MTRADFPADVDVAVVSHNGLGTLPHALACLRAAGTPDDRVVIYDIASTDGTAEWAAASAPAVTVTRLPVNNGPDPGRNLAIRQATRPYLLLLDADAFIRPDVPARLRAALDPGARVATTVPVVVHAKAPDSIQYAAGSMHFICEAINPWLDRPLADRGTAPLDIGVAPGVAYLIDVAVAHRIGLFDDRYFIGKEDGDFCHRLVMAGYRLVEDPLAIVEHGTRPRTAWLFPCQIRNRWHFMLKNYELRTLVLIAPALVVHEPLQLLFLILKGHAGAWWRGLRELRPWLRTLSAERREINAFRVVHDSDLFSSAPLIVRADMVGGAAGRLFKKGYDAFLGGYWRMIRPLLK